MSGSRLLLVAAALMPFFGCAPPPPPAAQPTDPALEQSAPVNQSGLRNTLKWTAASQTGNVAFEVFRSERPDGGFERVNPRPIPGAGTSVERLDYEYVDDSIAADTAYYYYIESVADSGARTRVTPILRAAPKRVGTVDSPAPR